MTAGHSIASPRHLRVLSKRNVHPFDNKATITFKNTQSLVQLKSTLLKRRSAVHLRLIVLGTPHIQGVQHLHRVHSSYRVFAVITIFLKFENITYGIILSL